MQPATLLSIVAPILLASETLFAQSPFTVRVDASDPLAVVVEMETTAKLLPIESVSLGGREFQHIDLGEGLNLDDVGLPDLPSVNRLVAVESGKYYEATIEASDPVVIENVLLAPVQPDMPDTSVRAPFRMNSTVYAADMEIGSETLIVGAKARLGGMTVLPLRLTPAHYNPARRRLTVWQRVKARVVAVADDVSLPTRVEPASLSSFQMSQIRHLVEDVDAALRSMRVSASDHVLVLATSDMVEPTRTFVERAASRGVTYEVREIAPGLSSAALKEIITERYRLGGLDSVLLFGDESKIALHYWTSSLPGDSFYGYVDGDDNYADIGVGRLPVSDADEARTLIEKLARYRALQDAGFVSKNVLLAAHKEEYPEKYTANMERIRQADNPRRLRFTTQYGGQGATNASVLEAINGDGGYAIVNYRGHGSETTWYGWASDGRSLGSSEVATLRNGDEKLAVFFEIACSNGALQQTEASLAESLLFRSDDAGTGYGAVAVLGATILSTTTTNHRFNEHLFTYLQSESNLRLANINALANNRLVRDNGGNMMNNVRMYVLFADPALAPWIE